MLLTRVNSGLDGIVVADTAMSEVDGEAGRLIVRGHAIEELTATRGFEGVAALLWEGYAEGGGDEAAVRAGLAAAREHAFALVPRLLDTTRGLNPVEALRVGPGARHAGRDRRGRARRSLVRRRLRQGYDPDGLRPSHLQGARSTGRRAE